MDRHLTTTAIVTLIMGRVITTLGEFVSTPTSVNATMGCTATFNCSTTTGVVAWIINGSLLSDISKPDITASQVGHTFVLHVPATEEYNNTVVQCALAVLGGDDLYSDPVFLKVQGLLGAVRNLKSESLGQVIQLNWDAPHTLDITGVDPDIWYQVDITVSNTSYFISRVVNISEFNFAMNDYSGTNTSVIYGFRITPINGAGDGITSARVTGYFSGSPRNIAAEMVVEVSADPLSVNFTITYGYIPPGETPDRFQVHAETIDGGDNDENKLSYCTDDIPVTPNLDGVVFIQLNAHTPTFAYSSSILSAYRKYKATIAAKNYFGKSNSMGEILFSTHEVQSCVITNCSRQAAVNISCTFAGRSKAMGYLSILCSKTNPYQEMFVIANRDNVSSSDLNISVSGIPPDDYTVVVFDLGMNGVPPVLSGNINYAAAEEENITVTNPGEARVLAKEVISVNGTFLEVPNTTNSGVKLCVSFGSSTNTDGTVVLAHRINNCNRLLAYFLNTTNCFTAPAAGDYIVVAFSQNGDNIMEVPVTLSTNFLPITSPMPSVTSTAAYDTPFSSVIVAVIVAVSILLVTVVVVTVVVTLYMGTKVKKDNLKKCVTEIEMKPNQAYETVTRPQPARQVHTEPCAAYGVVVHTHH